MNDEISDLLKKYEVTLVFDKASQSLKIMEHRKNKKDISLVPYYSIADTLQRIIFFKAAIVSNSNAVLLFEEPETHSFPSFIPHITQEMIYKKDNQYFVTTNNPFILNDRWRTIAMNLLYSCSIIKNIRALSNSFLKASFIKFIRTA